MYEVDFTGWVRTPEELEKLKKNKLYRLKLNFRRLRKSNKYQFKQSLIDFLMNNNYF